MVAVAGVAGDAPLPEPAAAGVVGEAPLLAPEVAGEVPLLAPEVVARTKQGLLGQDLGQSPC